MDLWDEFSKCSSFKVGDNSKISFLHDVCCGERPLKAVFLELYNISCLRDDFMADHFQFSNGSP